MNKFFLKIFLINLVCLIFLLADRYGKWLSLTQWATQKIELSFFNLTFLSNDNLIWNLTFPAIYIYILAGMALLILITYLIQAYEEKNSWLVLFLSLVLLGALSNVIDRVVYGYVIDYIDVSWWSVFNLADAGIVVGLFGWLILIIGKQSDKKRTMNNEQ